MPLTFEISALGQWVWGVQCFPQAENLLGCWPPGGAGVRLVSLAGKQLNNNYSWVQHSDTLVKHFFLSRQNYVWAKNRWLSIGWLLFMYVKRATLPCEPVNTQPRKSVCDFWWFFGSFCNSSWDVCRELGKKIDTTLNMMQQSAAGHWGNLNQPNGWIRW